MKKDTNVAVLNSIIIVIVIAMVMMGVLLMMLNNKLSALKKEHDKVVRLIFDPIVATQED